MDFFHVVSLNKAKEILNQAFCQNERETIQVNTRQALGKVLAQEVMADVNVPNFDRSTVDGYAVKCSNTFGASESIPTLLSHVASVNMGQEVDIELQDGQAVYVPTGAMIPKNADAVVMIEHCEKYDEDTLAIYKPVSPKENIIYTGEDIKKGSVILNKGRVIDAMTVAVLTALGMTQVNIVKPVSVFMISTGDEIIEVDKEMHIGQIRDANGHTLCALVQNMGCHVSGRAIVKDDYDAILTCVKNALDCSDIVLVSGGSSVGQKDFTYQIIHQLCDGNVLLKGISIKPGKPTIVGSANGKAVFGLPGHPVATILVFKALVEMVMNNMMGAQRIINQRSAQLDINLASSPGKTTFQPVKLYQKDGITMASPVFGKSGLITMLSECDGYFIIPDHVEGLNKGQTVDVFGI